MHKYNSIALISVIIPTLNEQSNLERLVPYLLTIQEIDEIIIVEADSTHQHYSHNDPKVTLVKDRVDSRAVQMNTGATLSSGDILVFLHADVLPQNGSFEAIRQKVNEGFVYGFFSYNFEPSGFLLNINASFTRKKGVFSGGGDQMIWILKHVFEKTGGYDADMVIMEDFDLTRKIKKHKLPYCIIDLPLQVSSRKYKNNSYLRVNVTNLVAFILFSVRAPGIWIKKWCGFVLR